MEDSKEPGVSAQQNNFLIVQGHSQICAISLSHVIEIMRPLPFNAVSGMPSFVLGLSLIRGSPTPVIGLESLLSGRNEDTVNRFVTLRVGSRTIAIAVKGVLGIGMIGHTELEAMPPLLQNSDSSAIDLIGSLESQLLIVLHSSRLLSNDAWQTLALEGAQP